MSVADGVTAPLKRCLYKPLPSASTNSRLNVLHCSKLQRLSFLPGLTGAASPGRKVFSNGRFTCERPRIAPTSASVQQRPKLSTGMFAFSVFNCWLNMSFFV
jgi:hypothetical protein